MSTHDESAVTAKPELMSFVLGTVKSITRAIRYARWPDQDGTSHPPHGVLEIRVAPELPGVAYVQFNEDAYPGQQEEVAHILSRFSYIVQSDGQSLQVTEPQ